MTEELWCVEWSRSQGCLHVQTVKAATDDNLLNALAGIDSDWKIIMIGSREACIAYASAHQAVIDASRERAAQGVRHLS